jgi:hypothetical protein
MPQWSFRDYKMRGIFFSGYRRNYLHNIIISRRTLRYGVIYAMRILGDKIISNDRVWKTFFRYTSFANLHKTYFETSPWPSDGELCLPYFRDQRSSNKRPTIQRKLIDKMKIIWTFSWHFGQTLPGICLFPIYSIQTLCQESCDVRSVRHEFLYIITTT